MLSSRSFQKQTGHFNTLTSIFAVRDTKFCSIPVTCTIMQKNGAGLHTASSCFWDNSTDGSCTVRWENKTMYCIVSVFGLAI
jgi:hypothetical protein